MKKAIENKTNIFNFSGTHILTEFYGVDFKVLNNEIKLNNILKQAIEVCGVNLLSLSSHLLEPQGVMCLALFSESHALISTYPKKNSFFLDIFTCGEKSLLKIVEHLEKALAPQEKKINLIYRGVDQKLGQINEQVGNGITRSWDIEIIETVNTPYQQIVFGRTKQGISLFCDGERQSTEFSQLLYHEGQFIPAFLLADKTDRVLVIGSSEGVVSKMAIECGVKSVIHIDIDKVCVEKCAKHLPYGYSIKELERFVKNESSILVKYEDGYNYVKNCEENDTQFDIIVMDLPDENIEGIKRQNHLYSDEFFLSLRNILSVEGAFITQAGCSTLWRNKSLSNCFNRMKKVFETVIPFDLEEHDWAWMVGSKKKIEFPVVKMQEKLKRSHYRPKYIDKLTIEKSTILPKAIRDMER